MIFEEGQADTAAHTEADIILCVGLNNVFQEEVTIGQAKYSKGQREELLSTSLSSTEAPFAVTVNSQPHQLLYLLCEATLLAAHSMFHWSQLTLYRHNLLHTLGHKYSQDQTLWEKHMVINLLSLFSSKIIHSKPQIPIS